MTTNMLLHAVVVLMHLLLINGRTILERSELNKSDLQAVNQLDMNTVTNPTDDFRSLNKLLQKETISTLPAEKTDQTATIPDNFRSLSKLLQKETISTLPVEKTDQTATIPDNFRSLSKLLQKETISTLPVEKTNQTATIPDNFRSLSKLLQKETISTLPVEKTDQTATIPIQPEPHHVLLKDVLNTMDKLVNLKAQQEPSSVIGSRNGEIFLLNFDVVSNPELLLDINLKPNLKNILIKDILLRDDLGKCITF